MLQFQLVRFGGGGAIQENVVVRGVLKMINFSGVPRLSLIRYSNWVLIVGLLLQAKEIYTLCKNFMYTGLSPVLSPCHFVLTSAISF